MSIELVVTLPLPTHKLNLRRDLSLFKVDFKFQAFFFYFFDEASRIEKLIELFGIVYYNFHEKSWDRLSEYRLDNQKSPLITNT
jgi:hypothetical protein